MHHGEGKGGDLGSTKFSLRPQTSEYLEPDAVDFLFSDEILEGEETTERLQALSGIVKKSCKLK